MARIALDRQGRLRTGWRIALQSLGFVTLVVVQQALQDTAVSAHDVTLSVVGSVVYIAGALLLLWAMARRVDRRRFADFGLQPGREWWLDLTAGLALGAFTMTAVAAVGSALGWVRFSGPAATPFGGPFAVTALAVLLGFVAIGLGEESTFRAYQGRNLAEWLVGALGPKRAVAAAAALTAAIFGVAHLANPNATLLSAVCVTAAGLVLGLAWLLSGGLALPLGMHVTWGFFEEFVFGFPNSGQAPLASLLRPSVTGPDVWLGGRFGPEAGLLMLAVEVVDVVLVVLWLRYRRRWQGARGDLAEYVRR
jgi:uncharacterized protein